MTKKETAEIIKLLMSYFRNNNDVGAGTMVDAWHTIFKDYKYKTVRDAVIQFAKEDRRDYPTMPSVGVILAQVDSIKDREKRPVMIALNGAIDGRPYEQLPEEVREILAEETYEKYLLYDPEKLIKNQKQDRNDLWFEIYGREAE